ncbi:MAG: sensor histidine kinase [Archangiaceae bacterium]|nr:sensor histidine kinase [Archangiaceae bacterium]
MRITTKLAVGLAATSALVLGAYGVRRVSREEAAQRATAEHDLKLLLAAVKVSVEQATRNRRAAEVNEVLESISNDDPSFEVFVFDTQGRLDSTSWGTVRTLPFATTVAAEVLRTRAPLMRYEGGRLRYLTTAAPLTADDGRPLGAVAIVQALDQLREQIDDKLLATVLTIATVFLALVAVGWLVIVFQVRRPLGRLVDVMTRVRQGDLSATAAVGSHDEIGELAAAFNAMVAQLAHEEDARRALEAGLQRVDKLVTVGQLSAGLAHEIGSPLQVLNGRARELAERPDMPASARRVAEMLVEQSDRIAAIVEQLLSYSRRTPAQLRLTAVDASVRSVVRLLEGDARRRRVTIELSVPDGLPQVLTDPEQVQQVVLNLLTNALRATAEGGRVTVGLQARDGKTLELFVQDTGSGIDEAVRARIFEPFFTTWNDRGGTGLGLAVVKSIVTEHRGTIEVDSKRDAGTRFTVRFPLAEAAPAAALEVA